MPAIIVAILMRVGAFIISGLIWRLLTSIGLGLVTANFVNTVASEYINKGLASMQGSIPASIAGLLHIAGVDESLSIYINAILMIATYKSLKMIFIRK